MTTHEARLAVRKVYDQWAAIAKLHEALEAEERAESAVAGLETRRATLTRELETLEEKRASTTQDAAIEVTRLRADINALREEKATAVRASQEARATAAHELTEHRDACQAERERLTAELAQHRAAHEERLTEMRRVEDGVMARITGLRSDLDAIKQRAASV